MILILLKWQELDSIGKDLYIFDPDESCFS
jgi:hypothetical protein